MPMCSPPLGCYTLSDESWRFVWGMDRDDRSVEQTGDCSVFVWHGETGSHCQPHLGQVYEVQSASGQNPAGRSPWRMDSTEAPPCSQGSCALFVWCRTSGIRLQHPQRRQHVVWSRSAHRPPGASSLDVEVDDLPLLQPEGPHVSLLRGQRDHGLRSVAEQR